MKASAAVPAAGIEQGVFVFQMDGMAPEEGLRKVKTTIERFRLLRRGLRNSDPKNAIPSSSQDTPGSSEGSLSESLWFVGAGTTTWGQRQTDGRNVCRQTMAQRLRSKPSTIVQPSLNN